MREYFFRMFCWRHICCWWGKDVFRLRPRMFPYVMYFQPLRGNSLRLNARTCHPYLPRHLPAFVLFRHLPSPFHRSGWRVHPPGCGYTYRGSRCWRIVLLHAKQAVPVQSRGTPSRLFPCPAVILFCCLTVACEFRDCLDLINLILLENL